jgi:hypothetical protein
MVLAPAPLHIGHGAEPVVLFDFEGGGHARNCTGVNDRRPLQITLTTARTHLAHIFEKTGTRRQTEVVPLILQSAGGIDQWRRRVLRLPTNMISIACPSACNWTPIDTGTAAKVRSSTFGADGL